MIMKTLNGMRALMLATLASAGKSLIVGEERMPNLPAGTYPCRVMFACGMVNEGTDEEPSFRLFNAWDGFSLNPEKTAVMLDLQSKKEQAFCEATLQYAVMFEVIGGKYAEKHAHIPYRFNLTGYKRREDFTDQEWLDSGYSEENGYAVFIDADGKHYRMEDEKRSAKSVEIFKGFLGAVFTDQKKEDGSDFDQIDLQLLCEEGNDFTCNVVTKADKNDPEKRIVPMFFNRFDLEKAEPKAEEAETTAEVPAQTEDVVPE